MKYDACTDEELIERLRQGETEITDYILEKYKPLVRKYANAMYDGPQEGTRNVSDRRRNR